MNMTLSTTQWQLPPAVNNYDIIEQDSAAGRYREPGTAANVTVSHRRVLLRPRRDVYAQNGSRGPR